MKHCSEGVSLSVNNGQQFMLFQLSSKNLGPWNYVTQISGKGQKINGVR